MRFQMGNHIKPGLSSKLSALLVTFLWSTSWILNKHGLESLPPLTFAGLRYFTAFLILGAYYFASGKSRRLKALQKPDWIMILTFGIFFILLTQGFAILALDRLPAITLNMIVNLSVLTTALLASMFLKERLHTVQWLGIFIFLFGAFIFFYPKVASQIPTLGLIMAALVLIFNSLSSILGRFTNRSGQIDPLTVTVISMGAGSSLLLAIGLASEPFPLLNLSQILLVLWLALVNTVLAFIIWNSAMRYLKAAEWSMINSTMLIQIALLSWLFLGEVPSYRDWLGIAITLLGILLVTGKNQKISLISLRPQKSSP